MKQYDDPPVPQDEAIYEQTQGTSEHARTHENPSTQRLQEYDR